MSYARRNRQGGGAQARHHTSRCSACVTSADRCSAAARASSAAAASSTAARAQLHDATHQRRVSTWQCAAASSPRSAHARIGCLRGLLLSAHLTLCSICPRLQLAALFMQVRILASQALPVGR